MKKLFMLTLSMLMLVLFSFTAPKAVHADDDGYKDVAILGCGCAELVPVFVHGRGIDEGDTCAEALEINLNEGFEIKDVREVSSVTPFTAKCIHPTESGRGLVYTLVRETEL